MKACLSLLAAVVALAGVASPARAQSAVPSAQTTVDPRWAPWLGCWRLADETINDPANFAEALAALQRSRANAGSLVCVTPAPGGATLTTLVNDQPVLTETIVPDAAQKAVAESDCRGWQRAEWSQLGARLFAQAEISCAGQKPRRVSGLSMMTAGPNWTDIQLIESEGSKSLRVRRYQRAENQKRAGALPSPARDAATMPLGARFSISDVKEASGKVAPEVLQAALVELKGGFNLNGKVLRDLGKAGVPEGVIDLMIAMTFPQRFVVDRASSSSSGGGGGYGFDGSGGAWGMTGFDMWPLFAQPYFYSSYYSPFGYRNWGYYDDYYFRGPGFVVVDPGQPATLQPSGDGRAVDGRGYTRVRRSDPEPIQRPTNADGGSNTASSSGSNSGSSSGSGNSGVSSSGYSGGGGGSERTAQPRPPGGR